MERLSHNCMLTEDACQTINGPVVRAVSAPLADALPICASNRACMASSRSGASSTASDAPTFAITSPSSPDADHASIAQAAVTYQLRRLRLHRLIKRVPAASAITSPSSACASPCSSPVTYNRILRPGLALALPSLRAIDAPLKRAFNKINTAVNAWLERAQLAAKT
jgi:hypothetical protein